jgi:hypothetical protein
MKALSVGTIAVVCTLSAGAALGCSCLGEEVFMRKDARAAEVLAAKNSIFHARVIDVLPNGNARIELIKSLKGDSKVSVLIRGTTYPTCEIQFRRGEEFVYLLNVSSTVQLCDRLTPTALLLRSIEETLANQQHTIPAPKQ